MKKNDSLTLNEVTTNLAEEKSVTAEIITEDVVELYRGLKKGGTSPKEVPAMLEALERFSNHALVRAFGTSSPKSPTEEFEPKAIGSANVDTSTHFDEKGANPSHVEIEQPDTIPVDNGYEKPHNKTMSEVTIDLLDAKLEAAEARTEARIARLEALVENSIKNNESAIADFREENKHTRRTMVITGVSSVVAIVLGVAAFNATLLSNMMGSFEMGQSSKDGIRTEVSAQNKELNEKLDKINEAVGKLSAPRL